MLIKIIINLLKAAHIKAYKIVALLSAVEIFIGAAYAEVLPVPVGSLEAFGFKPSYESDSYILYEINTQTILVEDNSDERLAPASITKVMSLILIYDAISSKSIAYDDIVTVSEHASGMGGSQVYLEMGEEMSVRDLIKSIVISSANDACTAMAEYISGSENNFVQQMNEKASELGMSNTNFVNCCGLDAEGHYSSARDIAVMSAYLLTNYPEIEQYTLTWMDEIVHTTSKGSSSFGLTNTNKMIRYYDGITGLKTGSTSQSGYSLSASARREDTYYVAVVLGADTTKDRFLLAGELLDYGFANTKVLKLDEALLSQSLKIKGAQRSLDTSYLYNFSPENEVYVFVDKEVSLDELSVEFEPYDFEKNVSKGECFGILEISYDDTILASVDMLSCEDINKITLGFYINIFMKKIFIE